MEKPTQRKSSSSVVRALLVHCAFGDEGSGFELSKSSEVASASDVSTPTQEGGVCIFTKHSLPWLRISFPGGSLKHRITIESQSCYCY